MGKVNTNAKTNAPKQPKTVKVKTLVIAVSVIVALVVSFVAGMVTANSYNQKVTSDAMTLAKQLSK